MLKNSIPFFFVWALTITTLLNASEEHQNNKKEAEKAFGSAAKRAYLAYLAAKDQCIKADYNTIDDCRKFALVFVRTQIR